MKNNTLLYSVLILLSILSFTSCDPQDSTDYGLGPLPNSSELDFSVSPTSDNANIIKFTNTSSREGVAVWDLGDGSTDKGATIEAKYAFKREYDVTMTLYTTGGSTSITKQVVIAEDDFTLLETPGYIALTGGLDNTAGKTWVMDRSKDGHIGVGSSDSTTPSWWSCSAEGKANSSLYNQEFTFTLNGVGLVWKNEGKVYTNEGGRAALAALGYGNSSVPPAGDFDVEYTPKAAYTFSLNETAKTLTLNDGAFLGHYVGASTYTILNLTKDELYLKVNSTIEANNSWWYRFVPKK